MSEVRIEYCDYCKQPMTGMVAFLKFSTSEGYTVKEFCKWPCMYKYGAFILCDVFESKLELNEQTKLDMENSYEEFERGETKTLKQIKYDELEERLVTLENRFNKLPQWVLKFIDGMPEQDWPKPPQPPPYNPVEPIRPRDPFPHPLDRRGVKND